jgi:transposase
VIGSTRSARVLAYSQPADMRKGFDGLYGLVRQHLERDPLSGDLYLFVSGNRKRAKVTGRVEIVRKVWKAPFI